MYSHVACDVMKERTLYLLKPSSLIWHLMPYLFLFTHWMGTEYLHFLTKFNFDNLPYPLINVGQHEILVLKVHALKLPLNPKRMRKYPVGLGV